MKNITLLRGSIKKIFFCLTLIGSPSMVLSLDCLQPAVVGICYWYYFYGSETSVLIGHFNPDVIVNVSNPQGVNRAEDGGYSDGTENRNHQNLIFQEASAYGHPLTGQLYCPSNTRALIPYYLSTLDAAFWRTEGLDALSLAATIPGLREIGRWPLNNWGAVYPRTGWTIQHSEPKSSGIVAQRVGDIITRKFQPHIYFSILGDAVFEGGGKIAWSPFSLLENTNFQGWWEELKLSPGSLGQCLLFGENDIISINGWGGGRVASNGEYQYALWRPYTCCEIEPGVLIKIQFAPYPVVTIVN